MGCEGCAVAGVDELEGVDGGFDFGLAEGELGAVEFGDVGRVVLPNSKVSVSVSTMSVNFRDGRRVEKSGYAPDVRVSEGGDALAAALEEIN